jgi:putative membrane protein
MFTDLILAIAHHLLMFALLAILVAELMMTRPGMTTARLLRLGRLDASYGTIAGLILLVGFARVFFGIKGPDFYLPNPVFWAKIAAFLLVGVLSIAPTLRIIAWRGRLKLEPGFLPDRDELNNVRRYMHMQAVVFVLIPIFAALMARGYGLS